MDELLNGRPPSTIAKVWWAAMHLQLLAMLGIVGLSVYGIVEAIRNPGYVTFAIPVAVVMIILALFGMKWVKSTKEAAREDSAVGAVMGSGIPLLAGIVALTAASGRVLAIAGVAVCAAAWAALSFGFVRSVGPPRAKTFQPED